MFTGFGEEFIDTGEASIFVRHAGDGAPLMLLHGHPRTSATWHRVAPLLVARGFRVVCPDLRGYGRSRGPAPTDDHSAHSKRAVAGDMRTVMAALGHDRFAVAGHDRGSYDSWYTGDPERMGPENYEEWLEAIRNPTVVRAMLEDYRAGLTIDRHDEEADRAAGRRLSCPTLVLWSEYDDLEGLYGDPTKVWANWADDVRGHRVASGHHMAEDAPDELAARLADFFNEDGTTSRLSA